MNTIAPELVERFRADLAQLWAAIDSDDARLGLAVSGGGDSLALLLLAHAVLPGRIEVGTVDHGLRARDVASFEPRFGRSAEDSGDMNDSVGAPNEFAQAACIAQRSRDPCHAIARILRAAGEGANLVTRGQCPVNQAGADESGSAGDGDRLEGLVRVQESRG